LTPTALDPGQAGHRLAIDRGHVTTTDDEARNAMAFKSTLPLPPKHPNGWYAYDAQGRILRLKTGLVVVPFTLHNGYWDVVIVEGNDTYPRGGYHICVFDEDLLAAEELSPVAT
jgi:hypothetical protein